MTQLGVKGYLCTFWLSWRSTDVFICLSLGTYSKTTRPDTTKTRSKLFCLYMLTHCLLQLPTNLELCINLASWIKERPVMTSDNFWWFLTNLPTMSDIFYLITSDFWESSLFYLLILKLDVIDGPARWTNQIKNTG